MSEYAIQMLGITKTFPGIIANDNVDLEVKKNEVLAILGENGAGKSTLMSVLFGAYPPDAGKILINGKEVKITDPNVATKLGIGMVHQHFKLVHNYTVTENIVLGRDPRNKAGILSLKDAEKRVADLSKRYGLQVDPKAKIDDITVGQQQRVEILKTLYRGADVLILDEPTAVLTPQETDELFKVIRRIVEEKDMTVIIITHKLYEVMAISDRVGVMRQGKLIGVEETKNVNERILASMMVGREVLFDKIEKTGEPGNVLIEADNLFVADNRGLMAVNGVSLKVRAGEILGVAAIEGNGQSELVEALTGMRSVKQGQIYICGQEASGRDPGEIRKMGLAHIPEDRISTGVAMPSSITDNMIIGKERRSEFSVKGIHLKRSSVARYARELFDKFDLRGAGVDTEVGSLSGGNMQKVVAAREFGEDIRLFIVEQPSRGIDVGAAKFLHEKLVEMRDAGCAILLVSADLDELFKLSDGAVVMYEGKISAYFPDVSQVSENEMGHYMLGVKRQSDEEIGRVYHA